MKRSDVDALFVDIVAQSGFPASWCLGASALLAQQDGSAHGRPALETLPPREGQDQG